MSCTQSQITSFNLYYRCNSVVIICSVPKGFFINTDFTFNRGKFFNPNENVARFEVSKYFLIVSFVRFVNAKFAYARYRYARFVHAGFLG